VSLGSKLLARAPPLSGRPRRGAGEEGGGECGGYQGLEDAVGGHQGGGGAADRPGAGDVGEDGGEDDDVGHAEPGAGPHLGGIEGLSAGVATGRMLFVGSASTYAHLCPGLFRRQARFLKFGVMAEVT